LDTPSKKRRIENGRKRKNPNDGVCRKKRAQKKKKPRTQPTRAVTRCLGQRKIHGKIANGGGTAAVPSLKHTIAKVIGPDQRIARKTPFRKREGARNGTFPET